MALDVKRGDVKRGSRSFKAAMVVGGLALAAGLGVAGHALAQQHRSGMAGGFGRTCDALEARQAGMLAFAEVRLGITDAERPAWTKFVAAVKASSAPVQQACAAVAGQPAPRTLPDRLHRLERIETARLEQLRQVTPAVEELYGALTAQQKGTADRLVDGMDPRPGMSHPPMHDGPPAGKAPN
jgi:protein CpxP